MLPNFFLAGAPKSGTTSLYHYLDQHPQIYMSPIKEPCYFSEEIRPWRFAPEIRRPSGIEEYLAGPMTTRRFGGPVTRRRDYLRLFERARGAKAVGEASVVYLWSPSAPRNIATATPDAKILLVLRDPIDRARSQYADMLRSGAVSGCFDDFVRRALSSRGRRLTFEYPFLEFGRYGEQLARYRRHFAESQMQIHRYEDYRDRPLDTIATIFRFLGVDAAFLPDMSKRYRASSEPPAMSSETRAALDDYYRVTPAAPAS